MQQDKTLVIIGAGGFGREVLWAARSEGAYTLGGFIDDKPAWKGVLLCDVPVLGGIDVLSDIDHSKIELIFGLGSPRLKRSLLKRIPSHFRFATISDPSVRRSGYVRVGEGTIFTAGCILTTQITIGRHINLNLDCTVGHDVVIEDFCNISPGTHINGHVYLEEGVDVGSGAVFLPGVRVGKGAVIGAGAVVTKNVPPYTLSVGIPAKAIKELSVD